MKGCLIAKIFLIFILEGGQISMKVNKIGEALGIEEYMGEDGYTYYVIDEKGKRTIRFDNIYSKWMRALYSLLCHIAIERDKHKLDINKIENNSRYHFFGLAESVADQLMYFFIKDQLSECNGNNELDKLCYRILFSACDNDLEEYNSLHEFAFIQLKRYLVNIVTQDFNAFTVGQFYDFYVSYWSCFESCVGCICEPYEEEISKKLNDSQFNDMKKFLKNLYVEPSDYEKAVKRFDNEKEKFSKKFGKYVSFPDKYTYLIKEVIGDKYARNEKSDRDFLSFCGAFRNTVHNNGLHQKADKDIIVKGETFSLKKGEKVFSDDYAKIFILAEELFDIYVAIIDGMDAIEENLNE